MNCCTIYSMSKKNILITGAKGQLGSYLARRFASISQYDESIGQIWGVDIDDFDMTDYDAVDAYLSRDELKSLAFVVHCAAATNTAAIESRPFDFYSANVLGARNIAMWCAKHEVRMVFISTDYVLSELSPVVDGKLQEFPVNQYGLQKLLAEQLVQSEFKFNPSMCTIVRSSWMFGNSERSFVEKLLASIALGYQAKTGDKYVHMVVDDAYGCPTHVEMIADCIHRNVIALGGGGTIECFSRTKQMTRYEWATIIWECFKQEVQSLSGVSSSMAAALSSIDIKPCSSPKSMMHHPGKLKTFTESLAASEGMKNAATSSYIASNIERLMKMFADSAGMTL